MSPGRLLCAGAQDQSGQDGSAGTARLETPAPICLTLLPDSPRHRRVQAAPAWPCQRRRLFPVLPGEGSWRLRLPMEPRAQIGAWGIQNLGGFSAGWVQSHPSHTGHPGSYGMGRSAGSLHPVPHQGGGRRMQTTPHQWWQSAARPLHAGLCSHPHAKPPPAWVPQLRRGPAPTSPSMAPLPLTKEGPMFPGSVAAMRRRLPGTSQGERSAGRTLSKHGVREHHPRVPEGLVHTMSAGTRDFAGDLPHPLCSKQPLSRTQGTAGVLGAGNHQGQRVAPGTMGTEMPPGPEATPQPGDFLCLLSLFFYPINNFSCII